MNLYLRLLLTLIAVPFRTKIEPLDRARTQWRVLPSDLDAFGHMNNGRYLAVMDLARVDFLARLGLARTLLERRWYAPVGAAHVEYKGALGPLERFEIETSVAWWDDKWFYLRQEFRARDSRVVAVGWVKVVFRGPAGTVKPAEVMAASGHADIARPPLDPEVASQFRLDRIPARREAAPPSDPIAIVGIGLRAPGGARDADSLWRLLDEGREAIVDIPDARWSKHIYHDPTGKAPGRSYVQRAGLLDEDVRAFDAPFFGISPREAATLDPQQRLLLAVSWEAFEDAGILPASLAGSRTGVFVGGFMTDNLVIQSNPENRFRLGMHSATASTLTMLSNRLSYFYDLRGPSISLDTACSSSLVAIHLACQSLWSGETDAALAGGVNVILVPETQVSMAKGRFLSPSGRCHSFSERADGYVRGEGAAVLVLKRLSDANRDGDRVIAVIRATASNQDGRTSGITLPNGDAQVAVMREAYARAGVDPASVSYVEAHGTGTPAGDPVEARAIGTVVGEGRGTQACLVGSLKANVGHLEAAAGVLGVVKAALCLRRGEVPRHLLHGAPNPSIDFDALGLGLPLATMTLPGVAGERVCGVNSFGYGGTNAHVVLGESPAPRPSGAATAVREPARWLPLSARSPEALAELAGRYAERLDAGDDVDDVARGAAVLRTHHRHRAAVLMSSPAASLRALARGEHQAKGLVREAEPLEGKLLFVYTGMGPQWWAMGRELLASEPVFRRAIEECDAAFASLAGFSIEAELRADESASRMARTDVAQPANAALQVALTALLAARGVVPAGALGHSIGEVGSAFAAGVFDVRGAMTVAYHRSRLQQRLAGRGGMLAAQVSVAEASALAGRHGPSVAIAAVNSARSVTFAGERAALEALAGELAASGTFHRALRVEVPYHGPAMDEIRRELLEALRDLSPRRASPTIYSTVEGKALEGGAFDAGYFWRNVRQTVRFSDAVSAAIDDGFTSFLEVGPHPVLGASIREVLREKSARGEVVATLTRNGPERDAIDTAVARLYALGAEVDHARAVGPAKRVTLPAYPWQSKVHWSESERTMRARHGGSSHPMLGAYDRGAAPSFRFDPAAAPWLLDHVVGAGAIFPSAGYVELVLAARRALTGDVACSIEEIEFERAAPLGAEEATTMTLSFAPDTPTARFSFRRGEGDEIVVARARVFSAGAEEPPLDLRAIGARLGEEIAPATLYAALERRGLRYGPAFRAVRALRRGEAEVLARLEAPAGVDDEGYCLHPSLVDAAMHALIGAAGEGLAGDVVPVGIDRVHVRRAATGPLVAYGRVVHASERELCCDVTIALEDGSVVCAMRGLRCRVMPRADAAPDLSRLYYERVWTPIASTEARTERARWVVVGEVAARGDGPAFLASNGDPRSLLRALGTAGERACVVDLRFRHLGGDDPVAVGTAACETLLASLRAIERGSVARYVVVTGGAEAVVEGDVPSLAAAPLAGLARTAMTERPDLCLTLFDEGEIELDVSSLFARLEGLGAVQEAAWRGGQTFEAKLARAPEPKAAPAAITARPKEAGYELRRGSGRGFEDLEFVACERRAPGPGEVEVEVMASSLGFKDVMKVLGLLSERVTRNTHFGDAVGMEGAGVVTRVGAGVTDVSAGDRVYGVATGFLNSHVVMPASRAVKLPANVDFEEGSNVIVFMTAHHALIDVARLAPGERVLIHGAAGGMGLAAIEVARACGAEVIATAGSEEKRRFLRERGVEHVARSRDVSFADDVFAWTQGRGVDVVLNFSPGEIVGKSLACLAPFGRFLEIGKMSFEQDAALPLRAFNENLLYAAIDFDRILRHKPAYVLELSREVLGRVGSGVYRTLPSTAFAACDVGEAFRFMARGKHIGKVCVRHDAAALAVRARPRPRFAPDRTYLVTGGLGGFGLEVARWAVAGGARHLALVSRRGARAEGAAEQLAAFAREGVDARAFAIDVASLDEVEGLIDEIGRTMPALASVIHSAAVLDDRPLAELDRASLDTALAPKARGAWNLHLATRGLPLDHFVLFSSVSSLVGNAGQGNYVAANAFVDQLALWRRARGLAATCVQWGVLKDTGLVARSGRLARHLERAGLFGVSTPDALLALGRILDAGSARLAVIDADWPTMLNGRRAGSGEARFSDLARPARDGVDTKRAFDVGGLDDRSALGEISARTRTRVAAVLRVPEADLDPRLPLRDAGMDSLIALEVATELESVFAVKVPSMAVAAGPSIDEIAALVLARLRAGASTDDVRSGEPRPISEAAE